MCDNRINKKVFIWANNICNNRLKNWNFRVHTKFKELDMEHFCNTNLIIDKHVIKNIENICFNRFKEQWYIDLMSNERSKLRTYRLFKNEFGEENYLLNIIPGKYRSAYAKFRSGTAPLKIETGRYEGLLVENRICYNSICN